MSHVKRISHHETLPVESPSIPAQLPYLLTVQCVSLLNACTYVQQLIVRIGSCYWSASFKKLPTLETEAKPTYLKNQQKDCSHSVCGNVKKEVQLACSLLCRIFFLITRTVTGLFLVCNKLTLSSPSLSFHHNIMQFNAIQEQPHLYSILSPHFGDTHINEEKQTLLKHLNMHIFSLGIRE